MAVQLDDVADRLTHIGSYPRTSDGWTYTGWVRIDVDRDDFSTWLRLSAAGSTIATCATGSDGASGSNYFTAVGSASIGAAMSTPATGLWVPVAGTRSPSSGDITTWIKPSGTGATASATADLATTDINGTPDQICLGGRGTTDPNEWLNGSLAHFRIWSAELSQGEIEAEWASPVAVRTTSLVDAWELETATDLTGVNGRTLTLPAGGSLTTVTGPDLGGAPVTGTLSGGLPVPTGSLTGQIGVTGTLSGLLPIPAGQLDAVVTVPGQLGGQLPAPVGQLAGLVHVPGQLSGVLPVPVGALAAGNRATRRVQLAGAVDLTGRAHAAAAVDQVRRVHTR